MKPYVPHETGKEHLGKPAGRPPISGESATGQIQLRVTMKRKNAYVRAAKPKSLSEWIFENLDKVAGFEP